MMAEILSLAHHYGRMVFGSWWPLVWILVKIHVILLPLLGLVTFLTLWERKVIGWMHARLGPNRVGPLGLMQPIADAFKLLLKEIIVPERADRFLFWLAPVLTIGPALAAWAVIPFGADIVLADVNAGLLFVMAITSIGVYGVIVAGWASNSKYALLGAVRASAQMISFGIPLGFVLVTVLLVSGSLNLSDIVIVQNHGFFASHGLGFLSWNWIPLFPLFIIYIVCAIAETARHPFDAVEGESEIVAGHMVEYSGMAFAMFFMAEYANIILLSAMASGAQNVRDIADLADISASYCNKMLDDMEHKGLVQKEVSSGMSRRAVYTIGSNIIRFFYEVVYRYTHHVEFESPNDAFELAKDDIDAYVERGFKAVCMDYVTHTYEYSFIGKLRRKDDSSDSIIDFVASVNANDVRRIMTARCRLRGAPFSKKDLDELMDRSRKIEGSNKLFVLFSGAGFDSALSDYAKGNVNVLLLSLDDIYRG